MKKSLLVLLVSTTLIVAAQPKQYFTIDKDSSSFKLTIDGATHLASLPLRCMVQEYPNKTSHLATSDSNAVLTPKQLHPAFYGCFDWHSCVHGHWMLVKLLKDFPALPDAKKIRAAINQNIAPENIAIEIKYFQQPLNKNYERTYGWAWLLKLQQELLSWKTDTQAQQWAATLQPFCDTVISLWKNYLPKQTYPNRTGVHPNTAFGLVFALDYARAVGDKSFEEAIIRSATSLYGKDAAAPARWEPDGTDFLSPSLEEADLMRRVLPKQDFIKWFNQWLPLTDLQHLSQLPIVSDRTDLQIVHLDGLCFSRSWCMKGIAAILPDGDKRKILLKQAAIEHLKASLPNVASGSYGGEHWLASFAVYALVNYSN